MKFLQLLQEPTSPQPHSPIAHSQCPVVARWSGLHGATLVHLLAVICFNSIRRVVGSSQRARSERPAVSLVCFFSPEKCSLWSCLNDSIFPFFSGFCYGMNAWNGNG